VNGWQMGMRIGHYGIRGSEAQLSRAGMCVSGRQNTTGAYSGVTSRDRKTLGTSVD
jgi:hypothetical protein